LVTLASRSGLSREAAFIARDRRLHLHDAATFDMQSDLARPFIVALNELDGAGCD